jgi:hypothetical protein
MATTIQNVTAKQIEALLTEASAAGDRDLAQWAREALDAIGPERMGMGSDAGREALRACVDAIRAAEAME